MKYTDREKKLFALAREHSKLNDLSGTIEILRTLVSENPRSAMFNATLANSLKEHGDVNTAVEHFQQSVNLAPKSELYSLGLFHCLWRQGKREEAFDEMKRFMAISDSADYRSILAEMNAKWSADDPESESLKPSE